MTDDEWHDLIITTAVLLGGEPSYYDYGHPERAAHRKYWSIKPPGGPDACGHTRWECARYWLWKKGITVTRHGTTRNLKSTDHRVGDPTHPYPHGVTDDLGPDL